jgi:hypothetical protein
LWLTIWASAGLSLRTGRKARDQRIGRALGFAFMAGNRSATTAGLWRDRHSLGTNATTGNYASDKR